jgi:hypothetical protein
MKKSLFTVGQSYSETSPESVEQGDFSDHGWEFEPEPGFSLSDLLWEIKKQGIESIEERGDSLDIYGHWHVESYRTGEEKQTCIHVKGSERVIARILKIIEKRTKK